MNLLSTRSSLGKMLKNFNIEPSAPESRIISVKRINESGENYFICYLYDNYVDYVDNIGILVATDEQRLREDLKNIYGIDYLSKRTFENFSEWFETIRNRPLLPHEAQQVITKFKI